MVDVKNNVVYFGYGDVAVGASNLGYMTFNEIVPPQEIGSSVDNENLVTDKIIKVTEFSNWELLKVFKSVSIDNTIVKYNGITFNFEHFKQGSLDVCLKYANRTVNLFLYAC